MRKFKSKVIAAGSAVAATLVASSASATIVTAAVTAATADLNADVLVIGGIGLIAFLSAVSFKYVRRAV